MLSVDRCLAALISAFTASIVALWEGAFLPISNLTFKRICGVVSDWLRDLPKSVCNARGRVNNDPLYDEQALEVRVPNQHAFTSRTSQSSAANIISMCPPGKGVVPWYHRNKHSLYPSSRSLITDLCQGFDSASPMQSPLQLNKVGIHEKGDCN